MRRELRLEAFPLLRDSYASTPMTGLDDLADWRLPGGDGEEQPFRRKTSLKSSEPACQQCGRGNVELRMPRRWQMKKSGALCCPVCCFIADCAAPFTRHHFASGMMDFFKVACGDFKWNIHANAGKNTTEEGKTAIFFADGNGIGRLMGLQKGVDGLRRAAMTVNLDLHERLRLAAQACMGFIESSGTLGMELEWLGGDDLVLRCFPRFVPIFESMFLLDNGGGLSYGVGHAIGGFRYEELNRLMTKAHKRLKSFKERLKSDSPVSDYKSFVA